MRLRSIVGSILSGTVLLFTARQVQAVEGQALSIQGTNVVLSWPSPGGYQQYMIQYRQTLDPSTPWTVLTNAFHANSSLRSSYTIKGAIPPAPQVLGSGGGSTTPPPVPMLAAASEPTEPMAKLADGTGSAAPVSLYPPGYDFSNFVIYDPAVGNWISGADYVAPTISPSFMIAESETTAAASSSTAQPTSGFFRVYHVPNWAFTVTNYVYDGPTFFPVDFADYMDRVQDFKVLINGQETDYANFMEYTFSDGSTNWGMGIDFERMPSGQSTIQLLCTVRQNNAVGDDADMLVLSNQVQTITIANQISYTNWNDPIQNDTYTFDINIANPNSDWEIDVFDYQGNYLNSGTGHTTDGHIVWTWDLTDYQGNSHTDFDSDPYFQSMTRFTESAQYSASATPNALAPNAANAGGNTSRANPLTVQGYPNVGEWVISFQERWMSDAPAYSHADQEDFMTAMGDIMGGPLLKGDPAWWFPIAFGTNVYSQADREASWDKLKGWLSSPWVRNWYYFGHGAGNLIGADRHNWDTNGEVTEGVFSYPGSKSCLQSWQLAKATRPNRYRFVFLDGCSTATGDWPNAFNISKTNHDIGFYENHPKHPRPSAFVGWNCEIGGNDWGTIDTFYQFRADWMAMWANSLFESLNEALSEGNDFSGWVDEKQLNDHLRVYGYGAMKMEDYNHKNDWRY